MAASIRTYSPSDEERVVEFSLRSWAPVFASLEQALGSAVDSGYKAEKISTLALLGKADLTDLATAVSAAEQALNTVVALSTKMIAAYQQISQMPM